jgi:quinol monooxygenase YgiN
MASKLVIFIVGTTCKIKDDAKFNKWYDEVHIPMLMKSRYLKGVSRYRAVGNVGDPPRYVAIYKFANMQDFEAHQASPELDAARKEMRETWGNEAEVTSRVHYELVKEFNK